MLVAVAGIEIAETAVAAAAVVVVEAEWKALQTRSANPFRHFAVETVVVVDEIAAVERD